MEEGLKLTYRAGRSELSQRTHEVKATAAGLTGTLAVDLGGKAGSTEASRGAEGVRTGAGGLKGTLLSATGMDIEVVSAEGVVVPPAAAMVPGGTWKNSLSVKLRPPGTAKSHIWFAPGVGIVKIATGNSTDLELLKVERPEPAKAEKPQAEKPKVQPATRKR